MKRKTLFWLVSLLVGGTMIVSCNEHIEMSEGLVGDGNIARFSIQATADPVRTKAEYQTADEKKVNSLDVWIFDGETLVVHKRASGDRVEGIRAKHGSFSVYALANAPAADVESFTSKAAVSGYHMALAAQARDSFFMSGSLDVTISDDSDIVIPVRRDVAKVQIKTAPVFSGIAADGVFEGAYLINVPKTYGTATVLTVESQAWNFGDKVASAPEQTVLLSVPTAAPTTAVYGMPNATAEAATREGTDYVTKLVLKCTVGGSTNWYGISIPDMQPNTIYEIDKVAINRFGSDTPNSYVMDGAMDVVVNVLDWETGYANTSSYIDNKIFHVYAPLTFEALTDGTITWKASNASVAGKVIEYSRDGGETWTELASTTAGASISVSAGEKIQLRGDNASYATSGGSIYNSFGGTARCYVYGYMSDLLPESDMKKLSADFTFARLFYNYTNLRSHPSKPLVLPATTLTSYCYNSLFEGCSGLTSAPELPATTLTTYCYSGMFSGCTGLTSAPELPATTLAQSCYSYMFSKCTGLTSAPELPATTQVNSCYSFMFQGCTNLTTAPELPATTLANSCYYYMFQGCTGLTSAPELPATTLANSCYYYMFSGCTGLTSTPELPVTTLAQSCYNGMFQGCTSLTSAPELPATTLASSCYTGMFSGCTGLTSAPELPATTLANNCYSSMFRRCTSLTSAPELPATTLANSCYSYLFQGCTSLTSAPELPVTTLAQSCYTNMFQGCTSLTSAPELPATTLVNSCYSYMFQGCTSLTSAPELPATTLANFCYSYMFQGCTNLTTAPDLPATILETNCYNFMFNGCSNLSYVKAMFTTPPSSTYTNNWLSGVKSTGTFVKNAAATWDVTGTSGIPIGWTVQTATE